MSDENVLGSTLARLRKAAGLTQQQLASAGDLPVSLVSQIERGLVRSPRLDTLRALAGVLGVTLDELAGEAEAPPADEPKKGRRRSGA